MTPKIIRGERAVLVNTLDSGTVIDTSIWTVANASDCVTMAQVNGVGLVFTNPHSCNTTLYANSLKSVVSVSSSNAQGASCQANINWTDDQPAPNNTTSGIMLWVDNSNYAMIRTDSANGNEVRLQISSAGVNVYDYLNTGISKGKDFRITFNFSTFEIKFWYKRGSQWVQMGLTKTYDIAQGNPVFMYIVNLDLTTKTGGDTVTFKSAFFYKTDKIKFCAPVLDTLISQDFTTMGNLNDYTAVTPASTMVLTGGYLRFTNAGSGGFANYLRYDAYGSTQLEKFELETIIIPRNLTASSFGASIGIISTNTTAVVSFQGFLELDSSANNGKVRIYKNGSAISLMSSALVYSLGDRIRLHFKRTYFTFVLTAYNMETGLSVSTSYTTSQSVTSDTPNTTGKPCLWSQGGIQDISGLWMRSETNKNVNILYIGNSITEGFSATTLPARYLEIVMANSTKIYSVYACVGSKTADILACMNEITLINAQYNIFMFGGNDVASGVSAPVYQSNYTSVRNTLVTTNGKIVIHCFATPRNAFDMSAVLNPFILSTFTLDQVIQGTYYNLKDSSGFGLDPLFDIGDGTHPNNTGHLVAGNTITSSAPQLQ